MRVRLGAGADEVLTFCSSSFLTFFWLNRCSLLAILNKHTSWAG